MEPSGSGRNTGSSSPEVEMRRGVLRPDDCAAALVVAIEVIAAVALVAVSLAKNCLRRIFVPFDSVFIDCPLRC